MGVDVGVLAGIGLEVYDLFDKNRDHKLSIQYFDDETDEQEFMEEFETLLNNCEVDSVSPMSGDKYFYVLAVDPINGIGAFLDELSELGFGNISKDDLSFFKEGYLW